MAIPEPRPAEQVPVGPRWPEPRRPPVVLGALAAALLLVAAVSSTRAARSPEPSRLVAAASDPNARADADGAAFAAAELPHAGLVPERSTAMAATIESAAVGPAVRSELPPDAAFGGRFDRCADLEHLLGRDLAPVIHRPGPVGCAAIGGVLDDPYLGRTTRVADGRSGEVAVDRIVSPAYAWAHGAADWTEAQRRAFAHDPLNRVVVDARVLQTKVGRGPSGWLPPNVAIRCSYSARFAEVATRYGLTIAAEDRDVARRQCGPG
jgi:hypothetical protein